LHVRSPLTIIRLKAYRITKKDLIERTAEIFKSRDKAKDWMKEPHKALGGKSPAECFMTRSGAEEVLNLLGRIEHGVYS